MRENENHWLDLRSSHHRQTESLPFSPWTMQRRRQQKQQLQSGCYSFLSSFLLLLSIILWKDIPTLHAMRIVVQRVRSASVTLTEDGTITASIGPGLLALVGLHQDDTMNDLEYCCKKLLGCKLWDNGNGGQWRHSVKQKSYDCLCVSQFTLYGTLSKKHQPDYKYAMKAVPAETMYQSFLEMLQKEYSSEKIHNGKFGAMMDVALVNDGPVTIVIDSRSQDLMEQRKENTEEDDN